MQLSAPDPDAVLAAFGIEGRATALNPVGRAWSNRVWRLRAGSGSFALKEMRNPWADPNWIRWLNESWALEQSALAAGISAPRPVPNPSTGGCLAWVSRRGDDPRESVPVRLHDWADGDPLASGPVGPDVARWAGQVLATLHGLRLTPRDRSLFPVLNTRTAERWPELTEAARRAGAPWADLMASAGPAVSLIADLARSAAGRQVTEVMSHGDIDQKNLVVTADGPVLCDWDLAVPLVPRDELADVALSLADWADVETAREVVRSYVEAGGDDADFESHDLGQSLMSGLDWAAFNIERALGQRPSSAEEISQANEQTPGLLAAIPHHVRIAQRIRAYLRA